MNFELRDMFAAHALMSSIFIVADLHQYHDGEGVLGKIAKESADLAYKVADTMLEKRDEAK